MTKLAVDDIHLAYGSMDVLKGISLDLAQGEVVALLGPSGSGKTTLLRAIAGLEAPHRGRISVDGRSVYDAAGGVDLAIEQRNFGMVFQSYALWPHRTVLQNVGYGLKLRGKGAKDIEAAAREALGRLGLGHLGERYPHQLSGGQQQRVAIARALVYNPPVILMDEPLSNLDANLREEAKTWLRSIIIEMQLSAIIVTHDQSEALAMGDRIVLLQDGKVAQVGTPVEIYTQPANLAAASFFGRNNRLKGRIVSLNGGHARVAGAFGELDGLAKGPLAVGDDCTLVLRAERLAVAAEPGGNAIEATHVTSMYAGAHWEHVFRQGEATLTLTSPTRVAGGRAFLRAEPDDVWLFAA